MAESKGALIAKSVQKHAGRAKEKLLQNLGKVDRTLDDIFEEHLQNFNRQHQQAVRLQKEFNNYIRCIRAVQTASKSLMEAITEVYESGWSGHDLLYMQAQNMEMLWQDFSHKLGDQVLIPINTYTNQFPEVRKKVEKRGRKLVDYDSQRHSFQNLQSNAAKRRDDVKVTRGREQLEEAKRTYEVLNSELHDELPALFDSRALFYQTNLQTLFSAEQLFHQETTKVFSELEAITDKLATDCQRGSYKKPMVNNVLKSSPNTNNNANVHNGNANTLQPSLDGDSSDGDQSPVTANPIVNTNGTANGSSNNSSIPTTNGTANANNTANGTSNGTANVSTNGSTELVEEPIVATLPTTEMTEVVNNNAEQNGIDKKLEDLYDIPSGTPVPPEKKNNNGDEKSAKEKKPVAAETADAGDKPGDGKNDEMYDIPVGATLAGLPPGALYRVRATYRYTREDSDELSFDVGELIRVVEYDDPDEQEEGWLMGIKESTNEKGMFPANFTRPI